ncbi:MAG: co-chaperone GroES [Firmicutes bacterium]|nr:co-chaperone GroES [Bacillota bacterium]
MKLEPLFDRIVIKEINPETTTASGIILPAAAQEKPQMATVTAVGAGGFVDGKEIKMLLKVGDIVLYPKYAGSEFKLDGETLTVLRQSDVLAKVIKEAK